MRLEVFALCDAATSEMGKLNILGAFDTIWAIQSPATCPQCAVALRIRFKAIERGDHVVTVNLVDVDGKHVLPAASGVIQVDVPEGQKSGAANLILNIQGLQLAEYGEYSIDLAIDGRDEASLPLFVKQAPQKG